MTIRLLFALAALAVAPLPARGDDERPTPRDEEARQDLTRLQGTWQLESLQGPGKGKPDVKQHTLFVGGELYLVRDGDRTVQAGVLRLLPTRTPRRIDVSVRKGQHEDNTMLGIYELKGDTLKLCFDPEGEGRPASFATRADSSVFVAVYKRTRPIGQTVEIAGKYKSESAGGDGKKQVMAAEIEKRGDAYLVRWKVPGGVAYLGMGIRQGSTLSVAWVNRGSIGLSVYQIDKGPRLTGVYTEVGGPGIVASETLQAIERDWVEVRNRR